MQRVSASTDLNRDVWKHLCSKFFTGASRPSYSEFDAGKIYHSGALYFILDIKHQGRKTKGFRFY
jgi:hypothetical protein